MGPKERRKQVGGTVQEAGARPQLAMGGLSEGSGEEWMDARRLSSANPSESTVDQMSPISSEAP